MHIQPLKDEIDNVAKRWQAAYDYKPKDREDRRRRNDFLDRCAVVTLELQHSIEQMGG